MNMIIQYDAVYFIIRTITVLEIESITYFQRVPENIQIISYIPSKCKINPIHPRCYLT